MRRLTLAIVASALTLSACSKIEDDSVEGPVAMDRLERNKEIARKFYEDLWFSNNTERYVEYVADEYVVHDVGPRKGVTEAAIEQKKIADIFHSLGEMTGEIDYQIAEGDKVATRWWISIEPSDEARASGMADVDRVAIINVLRFNEEGKIVEFWNHRHDVELPRPPDMASEPDATAASGEEAG